MSWDDKRQIDLFQDMAINVVKPLVPSDAEERVQNTFRQMNHTVRECIRSETGLKLAVGSSAGASIPVRVVEGFPAEFAQLINQYNNPAIWILLSAQTKLGGVIDGLQHLLHYWPKLE